MFVSLTEVQWVKENTVLGKKKKKKPHYNEYLLLTMKIYLLSKESTDARKVNPKFKCISKDQGQQEV